MQIYYGVKNVLFVVNHENNYDSKLASDLHSSAVYRFCQIFV